MRCRATPPARSTNQPCERISPSPRPPTSPKPKPRNLRHFLQSRRSQGTPMKNKKLVLTAAAAAFSLLASQSAFAQKRYDTGASDTEIRIGNIMPYSGPASAYGIIGKANEAYFRMINDQGGINGRKITFITYDDGYSPPKTVEQARKLVENDEVLLIFQPLGTSG